MDNSKSFSVCSFLSWNLPAVCVFTQISNSQMNESGTSQDLSFHCHFQGAVCISAQCSTPWELSGCPSRQFSYVKWLLSLHTNLFSFSLSFNPIQICSATPESWTNFDTLLCSAGLEMLSKSAPMDTQCILAVSHFILINSVPPLGMTYRGKPRKTRKKNVFNNRISSINEKGDQKFNHVYLELQTKDKKTVFYFVCINSFALWSSFSFIRCMLD